MASPFLDFVEQAKGVIPGGMSAIPSLLAGLMVKKPALDLSTMYPLYQSIAANAAGANNLAAVQSQNYTDNYLPAAVNFNSNAQGVGGQSDQAEAADRQGANFRGAFDAAKANATRDMAGVNPNSGAAQARMGAIDASFAPGLVDSMNKGRVQARQYGDTLRATALPFLNTTPNFSTGMYGAMAGANLVDSANKMYRQQVGDTTKALKMPFDLADEERRQAGNGRNTQGVLDAIKKRFPVADAGDIGGANRNPAGTPPYVPAEIDA